MTEEFAVLFEMLENLARAKSKVGGSPWGQLVYASSNSAESGYRVYLIGEINMPGDGEFSHSSVGRTIARGAYESGVYAMDECIGGTLLTPNHKVSVMDLMRWLRRDSVRANEKELIRCVIRGMRMCLKRNGIEPSLSAEDESSSHGLHLVQ
jgi:hypothetical protein